MNRRYVYEDQIDNVPAWSENTRQFVKSYIQYAAQSNSERDRFEYYSSNIQQIAEMVNMMNDLFVNGEIQAIQYFLTNTGSGRQHIRSVRPIVVLRNLVQMEESNRERRTTVKSLYYQANERQRRRFESIMADFQPTVELSHKKLVFKNQNKYLETMERAMQFDLQDPTYPGGYQAYVKDMQEQENKRRAREKEEEEENKNKEKETREQRRRKQREDNQHDWEEHQTKLGYDAAVRNKEKDMKTRRRDGNDDDDDDDNLHERMVEFAREELRQRHLQNTGSSSFSSSSATHHHHTFDDDDMMDEGGDMAEYNNNDEDAKEKQEEFRDLQVKLQIEEKQHHFETYNMARLVFVVSIPSRTDDDNRHRKHNKKANSKEFMKKQIYMVGNNTKDVNVEQTQILRQFPKLWYDRNDKHHHRYRPFMWIEISKTNAEITISFSDNFPFFQPGDETSMKYMIRNVLELGFKNTWFVFLFSSIRDFLLEPDTMPFRHVLSEAKQMFYYEVEQTLKKHQNVWSVHASIQFVDQHRSRQIYMLYKGSETSIRKPLSLSKNKRESDNSDDDDNNNQSPSIIKQLGILVLGGGLLPHVLGQNNNRVLRYELHARNLYSQKSLVSKYPLSSSSFDNKKEKVAQKQKVAQEQEDGKRGWPPHISTIFSDQPPEAQTMLRQLQHSRPRRWLDSERFGLVFGVCVSPSSIDTIRHKFALVVRLPQETTTKKSLVQVGDHVMQHLFRFIIHSEKQEQEDNILLVLRTVIRPAGTTKDYLLGNIPSDQANTVYHHAVQQVYQHVMNAHFESPQHRIWYIQYVYNHGQFGETIIVLDESMERSVEVLQDHIRQEMLRFQPDGHVFWVHATNIWFEHPMVRFGFTRQSNGNHMFEENHELSKIARRHGPGEFFHALIH